MLNKTFSLIVAVNALGYIDNGRGGLPWDSHFKADMDRFKAVTWGKIVVMGRKTYDSIGHPLPGRINVVLTHDRSFLTDSNKGLYICHTFDEFNQRLATFTTHHEIVIIGGGQIYNLFKPYYETMYITEVVTNNTIGTIRFDYPKNGNGIWALDERRDESDDLTFVTLVNTAIHQTPHFNY